MDVTASTITVVTSVWTLTVHCKQFVEGFKNGEEKAKELERKARSFAAVVEQVRYAYGKDAVVPDDEKQIRENIQAELSRCKEDIEAFEEEVSKLLRQRKTGKFGVGGILNNWRETVSKPIFERVEKSMADHLSYLQSLMAVHHGRKLDGTRKDIHQVQSSVNQLFDKLNDFTRAQGSNAQEDSAAGGIDPLQRRESDITLVNSSEDENPNALHAFAQSLFMQILNQMTSNKGSISLPSSESRNPPVPSRTEQDYFTDAATDLGSQRLDPRLVNSRDNSGRPKKPSFDGQSLKNYTFPTPYLGTPPLDGSPDFLSLGDSPTSTMRRSVSGTSGSLTLAQISSECIDPRDDSDSVKKENGSYRPLDEGTQNRTNKTKGAELLEVIRDGSDEHFKDLLQGDASLEEKDIKGKTPLILAASLGKIDMVDMLLAKGANAQAVDNKQATALHNAIESLAWPVLSLLLKHRDTSHKACRIDVNFLDKRGRTPLHCCTSLRCAEDNMKEAVGELIAREADIDIKDNSDKNPVYYAIKHRRYSVVELFLNAGADLNFERPDTSPDIGRLLDNHLAEKSPSPMSSKRKDSAKPPGARKGSRILSFSRSRSNGDT